MGVKIKRAGHAAHQPVGVGVFAAKNGVYLHHILLKIESFQIVGNHKQVGLWRQLVGWVAPVAVGEDAKLPRFDNPRKAVLDRLEVTRRRIGPWRELVRKLGCGLGVCLGSRNHIHPVKTSQMVQVHQMVMVHEAQVHDVADNIGVVGNFNAKGIFYRMHRGKGVRARAYAADAFHKGPCIARVAPFKDDFYTSENSSARYSVGDDVVVVKVYLAPQVPLNAGNRVNNNAAARILNGITL